MINEKIFLAKIYNYIIINIKENFENIQLYIYVFLKRAFDNCSYHINAGLAINITLLLKFTITKNKNCLFFIKFNYRKINYLK